VRRVRLRGLVLAAVATVLAACGGIPTSGQVVPHEPIDAEDDTIPDVGGVAQAPQPGDTPERIVFGFLEAMKFYETDYETARKFLTPAAAREWQPEVATTIYDAEPLIHAVARDRVVVTISVAATLEGGREYTKAAPDTEIEYGLAFEQIGDEWRIATPPPGLVIRDADFDGEFRAYNLFYFDPAFSALVPDPVYLPTRGRLATLLAQELLAGPSPWLAPAVATAFPEGTELAVDAVTVTGGDAEVRLTEAALAASESQRGQMVTQLAWTLGELPAVTEVVVHGGPRVFAETSVRRFPDVDPAQVPYSDLFAISDEGVRRFDSNGTVNPVLGPLGEFEQAAEVAVDLRMTEAAVINEARTLLIWSRLRPNAELQMVADGRDLRSPSFDRTGLVWVVDGNGSTSRLLVAGPAAEPSVVEVSGLEEQQIDAVAVSADGTRIALVSEGAVYIGVVVRTGWPAEVQVERLRQVDVGHSPGVADVAWNLANELAVLTRAAEDDGLAERVYLVNLSTYSTTPAGEVPGAESITSNWREARGLAVGTAEQLFQQQPTLDWVPVEGLRQPTYPG
jgi:hypothetical protein